MSQRRFFTAHQAAVVCAATARLIPGPLDDPAEQGSPGAREADVTTYIDCYLSALDRRPAFLYAGGPWSTRSGGDHNGMVRFVPPAEAQAAGWRVRLARLRAQYCTGIALLDRLAAGDFTAATVVRQDTVLCRPEAEWFRDLLFDQAIEGMYAAPEYGGNRDLAGWRSIDYRGDTQPDGYRDAEVTDPDPADPVADSEVLRQLITQFDTAVWYAMGGERDG